MLVPRQKTPALSVPTLNQEQFDLASETNPQGTVICFYRGLHCPLCATYLKEFQALVSDFAERGFETIAISSDGKDRTEQMAEKVDEVPFLSAPCNKIQYAPRDHRLFV